MSVSEGLKKYNSKNYFVKLTRVATLGTELKKSEQGVKQKIQPWTRIFELKTKISKSYNISPKNIRLFYTNIEMMDDMTILDYKIIDAKKPEIFYQISSNIPEVNIQVYGAFPCSIVLNRILDDINNGFMEGLVPNIILEGTSGTYNMRNTNKEVIALFKPIDEEAFAPNNQKGYVGKFGQESFRKGILSGEGSVREVAAYLLDRNNIFDVPESTFVEVSHPTFNKNNNDLLTIDNSSMRKMRNSIVHNFVMENIIPTLPILTTQHHNSNSTSISNVDAESSEIKSKSYTGKYNYIRKKYGSLQKFIKSSGVLADFSSSLFSDR
jgi:hypothetical protein